MTGPAFMRSYGAAHDGHWIKQVDQSRSGTPVAITDDAELVRPIKPSTIYLFKCVLFFTGAASNMLWVPACTSTVDFAAIFYHRQIANLATEVWGTASPGEHVAHLYDTAHFNAQTGFNAGITGAKRAYGMIQFGSGGGIFSVKWGGGNGACILEAGSFIYLKEATAY